MNRSFDAIIIGAGQAGPSLAGRLTAAGMKVALIERKLVGGTCVNTGCMPTKAMVASAYAAHLARRAGDYGVSVGGGIAIDMKTGPRARGQGDARRPFGPRKLADRHGEPDPHPRACAFHRTARGRGERRHRSRRRGSSLMSAAGRRDRICPASTRSRSSTTPTWSRSTRCRATSSWSAAAMSGSNSRRCSAASAPR